MKASFRKIDILAATVLTGLVSTAVLAQVGVGEPSLLKRACPAKLVDEPGGPYQVPAFLCEPDQKCGYAVIKDAETDDVVGAVPACIDVPV